MAPWGDNPPSDPHASRMARRPRVRERWAMTSADFRDEPATEVLDLYDVLPEAGRTPARTEEDAVTAMIKGVGRNLAAIIGMFAVYLPAFIVCTTLFNLGV